VVLERPLVIKRSVAVVALVRWSVGRRVGADQELVDCQTIGRAPLPSQKFIVDWYKLYTKLIRDSWLVLASKKLTSGSPTLTMTTWKAHSECPTPLKDQVELYGNSITPSWRTEPLVGDVFDSPDHAFARLQAFAFLNGFAVVIWRSATKDARVRYRCIHHNATSKNWRELEQRVERDTGQHSVRTQEDTELQRYTRLSDIAREN